MLANRIYADFDVVLRRQKLIRGTDVSCVHGWMDNYLKLCSWHVREAEIAVCEVKTWVIGECGPRSEEALNDYLRAALGHLVVASVSAGFAFENEYELLKRAFQLYLERNYDNCSIENSELLHVA